jgi:hypothetical protein
MSLKLLIAIILFPLSSSMALGQTACPQGVASGGAQCGPSSMINSAEGSGDRSSLPSLPPAEWADSWGAMAMDDSNGVAGIVTDLSSKRTAKKAAIQECRSRGGVDCTIARTYKNQCLVVVASSKKSQIVNAATINRATELAMRDCENDGSTDCRIYYSGCSIAKRVR